MGEGSARELALRGAGGVLLAGEQAGEGTAVVLLHGLTATRRYVVMGSNAVRRGGHRVIAYDARGHGRSQPAPDPASYGYQELATDLEGVLDSLSIERAVLAGASMGAHTAVAFALRRPERVSGLVLITPAYDPEQPLGDEQARRWDALADAFDEGGIEGFVTVYAEQRAAGGALDERWRETVLRVVRQRLARHAHPEAVADALRVVPRSRPFESWAQLSALGELSAVAVVASRDEADPEHPFTTTARYAEAIPGAALLSEEPGHSPLAWQGAQLSRVIASAAARAADTLSPPNTEEDADG